MPPGAPVAGQGKPVDQRHVRLPAGHHPDPPGIRKLLANLSGRIDFSPTIQTEHFPALVKIVRQSNAIGVGTEEAFVEDIEQGSLALLHWRNLPQNIESMNARCGIVSRTGFRLSPAARKMIEVLVAVDRQQVSIAS
nr:LysR substrate-binding domain-containing protein [Pseudomonas chlororaphis]